jgi:hypothetical protein
MKDAPMTGNPVKDAPMKHVNRKPVKGKPVDIKMTGIGNRTKNGKTSDAVDP